MLDTDLPETDLPVHPFTGLAALAVLDSGRVVWPVLGGADDGEDEDRKDDQGDAEDGGDQGDGKPDGEEDGEDGEEDEGDKPLGPKGQRALAAMKEKLKAERTKRREAEAKLAGKDKPADDKPDPEAAATARANARILRSEIKAAAAGKLADPKDALRLLDVEEFTVDEDGEVDEDEIAEAIEDLLKRKPYLAAAAQGGRRRFEGGADGGARKGAAKPITEEQLTKMTPTEIEKALDEGKLAHLL